MKKAPKFVLGICLVAAALGAAAWRMSSVALADSGGSLTYYVLSKCLKLPPFFGQVLSKDLPV